MTAGDETRDAAYKIRQEAKALNLSADEMSAKAKELDEAATKTEIQADSMDATERDIKSTLQEISRS